MGRTALPNKRSHDMAVQAGDTGPEVEAIQQALRALSFPLATDGVFGPRTTDAVRGFQAVVGLTADGIVGPSTHTALFDPPGAWAEVHVNANPKLALITHQRQESINAGSKTTVFDAEVSYPRVQVNPTFFRPGAANAGLRQRVEHLVAMAAADAEIPFAPFGPSFVTGEIEATLIASSLIGMHGNLSVYVSGAAHPNPMPFLATMDLANDAFIPANELWMPGVDWPTALRNIALMTFAPGPGLAPVPDNYKHQTVTPSGIKVVFEPFQVLPGAAGAPSFTASWDRIEALVRPSIAARSFGGDAGGPGPHI